MNYIGKTYTLLDIVKELGLMWKGILIIAFIIHIFFVITMVKLAIQKEENNILWGVLSFIVPELAFILFNRKINRYSEYPSHDNFNY